MSLFVLINPLRCRAQNLKQENKPLFQDINPFYQMGGEKYFTLTALVPSNPKLASSEDCTSFDFQSNLKKSCIIILKVGEWHKSLL